VRPLRSAAVLALLLAAAGCRHASPPTPLPPDWQRLVREPRPYAAMYRFSCCAHSDLVLTLRGDRRVLSLTLAVPPGGTALAAWITADGGWVERTKERCRERLAGAVLPLSSHASLPLDPELASLLLAGLLPAGAREVPRQQGWVEATAGDYWWRARIEGPDPHWTRVVIGRRNEEVPLVNAVRSDPNPLPHELTITAGSVKAKLVLQVWQESVAPASPAWLAAPVCGGGS
jgi:hypothetical protein